MWEKNLFFELNFFWIFSENRGTIFENLRQFNTIFKIIYFYSYIINLEFIVKLGDEIVKHVHKFSCIKLKIYQIEILIVYISPITWILNLFLIFWVKDKNENNYNITNYIFSNLHLEISTRLILYRWPFVQKKLGFMLK